MAEEKERAFVSKESLKWCIFRGIVHVCASETRDNGNKTGDVVPAVVQCFWLIWEDSGLRAITNWISDKQNTMEEFFLRIIAWHKKNNPGLLDRLNPGIESYDALIFFTTNSLVIPNELIELYSLSNGSDVAFGDQYDLFHFFPGYYLLSFQESTHIYQLKKMDELWSPDWFPIFSNGGGDYYAIKCSKEEKFPIVGFLVGGIESEIEYTNLTSMLKTIADCFDNGAFYLTDERYLEILLDKEAEISRSNNQGLPRWN